MVACGMMSEGSRGSEYFEASTNRSRRPASTSPTMSSLPPYASAVSITLPPDPAYRSMIGRAWSTEPNRMAPRNNSETRRPVRPNNRKRISGRTRAGRRARRW